MPLTRKRKKAPFEPKKQPVKKKARTAPKQPMMEVVEPVEVDPELIVQSLNLLNVEEVCNLLVQENCRVKNLRIIDIQPGTFENLMNALLKNSSVKSLTLKNCGLGTQHAALLGKLLISTSIEELDVSKNYLGNEGIGWLAWGLAQNSEIALKKLSLAATSFSNGASYLVQTFEKNSKLRRQMHSLDLSFNPLGKWAGNVVSSLVEQDLGFNKSLAVLKLNNCNINSSFFESDVKAVLCKLTSLEIAGNICINKETVTRKPSPLSSVLGDRTNAQPEAEVSSQVNMKLKSEESERKKIKVGHGATHSPLARAVLGRNASGVDPEQSSRLEQARLAYRGNAHARIATT